MTIAQCRTALETQLATVTSVPAIAYENVVYQPTPGTPWLRCWVATSRIRTAGIGVGIPDRADGILIIDLFYPPNAGPQAADAMIDAIRVKFAKGTELTASGQVVHISFCEPNPIYGDDADWYMRSVHVGWYAFGV